MINNTTMYTLQKYKFCPKCGGTINPNASFCGQCGFSAFAQDFSAQNYNTTQIRIYPPFTENYYRYNYTNSQIPKKTNSWLVALIILLVVIFVIVPAIFTFVVTRSLVNGDGIFSENFITDMLPYENAQGEIAEQGEPMLPSGVSKKEYQKCEIGMSYAQVSFIIGGDALAEDTGKEKDGEFIAVWPGEYNTQATVAVTFVGDKVIKIEQVGLF